jgi:hypothetical protein
MFVLYGIGSGAPNARGVSVFAVFLALLVALGALRGLVACIESFDRLLLAEPDELESIIRNDRRSIWQRRVHTGVSGARGAP